MSIKFSCIVVVFFFSCSEKKPMPRHATQFSEVKTTNSLPDPTKQPISPARAPDLENPWSFYRKVDSTEVELFLQHTNCLTPGEENVMASFVALHHLLERVKELEKHDPGQELPDLRVYIRQYQKDLKREIQRMKARVDKFYGFGFLKFYYYINPTLEQAARLASVTFYEAVVPENSPRYSSLLYWPEFVEPKLIEWQKGLRAQIMGGPPADPNAEKGWSQGFYLVPQLLVIEIQRPLKFANVQSELTKLAHRIDADLLSVTASSLTDDMLKVQMLYRHEPEIATAVQNVSVVRQHPLVKKAYIGIFQNQYILMFWPVIIESSKKIEPKKGR